MIILYFGVKMIRTVHTNAMYVQFKYYANIVAKNIPNILYMYT